MSPTRTKRIPFYSIPVGVLGVQTHKCSATCLHLLSLQAYGLKRLARGLASSRQGARQGFAAALAATIAHSAAAASSIPAGRLQRPFVSAAGVLALLDACLEVTGSMKGTVSVLTSLHAYHAACVRWVPGCLASLCQTHLMNVTG